MLVQEILGLNVNLRGQREYLQSADIFGAICDVAQTTGLSMSANLTVTYREFAKQPIFLSENELSIIDKKLFDEIGEWRINNKQSNLGGLILIKKKETNSLTRGLSDIDHAISAKVKYTENKSALITSPSGVSTIQVGVSIGKHLLQKHFGSNKKWVVVKMSCTLEMNYNQGRHLEASIKRVSTRLLAEIKIRDLISNNSFTIIFQGI